MWCRDILLKSDQVERLIKKQRSGSCKGAEKLKRQRIIEVEILKKRGLEEVGKLSKRDFFIAGVGIYWGEGYKYAGGDQVGFTNSDPKMILFMMKWFQEICNVPKEQLSLAVRVNQSHKYRAGEIERYWSNLAEIPIDQFNKTVLIKSQSKKIYPSPNGYFGTLRITVRRGSRLRRKIHGWIEGLAKGAKI